MPRLRLTGRGMWITALIVPPLAVMAVFVAYPILSALAYAFFHWNGLARSAQTGSMRMLRPRVCTSTVAWPT